MKNLIKEIKKNFMGPKITKEGNRHWGTDDLHEHCLVELGRMSIEEKLQFLVDRGYIEVEPRDAWEEEELHLDSMNLELPEEGGKVIPIIIGEPLPFRSREEDQ